MNERVNLVTLASALMAIVCYLAAPILRLAFVVGVSGINAINWLSSWFILPVIFIAIMLVVSFAGSKTISISVSAATVMVLLIMMLTMKDLVAAGNLGVLANQLGAEAEGVLGNASTGSLAVNIVAQVLVNPGWGFFATIVLVIFALVGSLLVNQGTTRQKREHVSNHTTKKSNYDKLYRR